MTRRNNVAVVTAELRVSRDAFEDEMDAWARAKWAAMSEEQRSAMFALYVKTFYTRMTDETLIQQQASAAYHDVLSVLLGEAGAAND